jgi:hypothetical protein
MGKINILIILSLIFSINLVYASPFYYNVSVDYNKGKFSINSIGIVFSQEDIETKYGNYKADIVSIENKKLSQSLFRLKNVFLYDTVNESTGTTNGGGIEYLEKTSFNIFVPYLENAKDIVLYDENNSEIARADVSIYSKLSGKVSREPLLGGDKDEHGCIGSAGYSWCEEKQKCLRVWEEKCSDEVQEDVLSKAKNYWWIIGIAAAIVIGLAIYFSYPKKKQEKNF